MNKAEFKAELEASIQGNVQYLLKVAKNYPGNEDKAEKIIDRVVRNLIEASKMIGQTSMVDELFNGEPG